MLTKHIDSVQYFICVYGTANRTLFRENEVQNVVKFLMFLKGTLVSVASRNERR
jgi:hypothetical protein